jgi:hypothetical protein
MPKIRHEAVVEILQNEPELVLSLLECLGMHLGFGSPATMAIADSNLSDRDAADEDEHVRGLFSDNVFVFEREGRRVAVIAEVQAKRPDEERSLSWPAYVANARRRNRCDALLMVFAITKDAARGSAKTIRTGHPGWDLIPLVSGIGLTPGTPSDDGRFAAELVLLRVITRELTLSTHDARMFALTAIRSAPPERIERYTRYLKALVPASTRERLEALMKTVLKDDFIDGYINQGRAQGRAQGLTQGRAEGLAQGLAQGRAEMLLTLLEMRFNVPDDIRKRVEECNDGEEIMAWFTRAPTAASLDEVFA